VTSAPASIISGVTKSSLLDARSKRTQLGDPMTLGNMRANGVRSLDVCCCATSADPWSDAVPALAFGYCAGQARSLGGPLEVLFHSLILGGKLVGQLH
jgi:hypothetical protein